MNTQNQAQIATPAAAVEYFDSVLYCRAYLNEVKLVDGKKGKKPYCAINASFLEAGADGKTVYRTIDLIVRGKPAKELLWQFKDRWPANRMKREANPWLADVNIGSIRVEAFRKRDGSTAAVLKGRLLNIRALKLGEDVVHGNFAEELPQPVFVAPCYINEILPDKGRMKIAALDGPVNEPESFGVNLDYCDNGVIAELLAMGICPKGSLKSPVLRRRFTRTMPTPRARCKACASSKPMVKSSSVTKRLPPRNYPSLRGAIHHPARVTPRSGCPVFFSRRESWENSDVF